jgi:hypothetical protein
MPKIDNNPLMKGARGMLGGVVVYRQFRGKTIMSNRPRKAKVLTPHQQATKSRFLLAVEYAKKQIADPVLKAKYQPSPGSKFTSAYISAIADYLRRAKRNENGMEEKETESSHGALGQKVIVNVGGNKIDVKTATIRHFQDIANEIERYTRTGSYIANRNAVTVLYMLLRCWKLCELPVKFQFATPVCPQDSGLLRRRL